MTSWLVSGFCLSPSNFFGCFLLCSNSDFVDVNIGYQFVNILYRDTDGSLGVDIDLINDVREQDGGGGEPLMGEDEDLVF